MKTLRFLGMALLAVIMCVNLTACSDDDEPESNKSLIGVWIESWYDDVIEIKADGSGYWAEFFGDSNISPFTWTYDNGLFRIIDESDIEEAIMVNQSDNKIVWKHYVDNPNAYDPSVINKDDYDYGYYYIWNWERYTE